MIAAVAAPPADALSSPAAPSGAADAPARQTLAAAAAGVPAPSAARVTRVPAATAASWMLMRECTGRLPATGSAAAGYRAAAADLARALAEMEALRPLVEDDLHRLVGAADGRHRARVLLPLRRAVHNHRPLGPALAAAADELELPRLRAWRAAQDEAACAVQRLAAERADALTAGRIALAEAAGDEPVVRAAGGTSALLAQAVLRYAARGGDVDRRSTKSEPTVLRHVLRASTKTVPLGWFVRVGWAEHGAGGWTPAPMAQSSQVRASLAGLAAVAHQVEASRPADERRLRLAPDLVAAGGTLSFTRRRGERSEAVRIRRSDTLDGLVAALHGGGRTLDRVAVQGVLEQPSDPPEAAAGRLAALESAGLLQPAAPLPELDAADPERLARWCAQVGRPEVAAGLRELAELLRRYAGSAHRERGPLGAQLEAAWARLPGTAQAPLALMEDVVGAVDRVPVLELDILERLTPVCEVFDWLTVVRRAAAVRWAGEVGPSGAAVDVATYARAYDRMWSDPRLLEDPAIAGDPVVQALLRCRRAVAAAATTERTPAGLVDTDLGAAALEAAARGLPAELAGRPYSVAFFVQQTDTGQVVNDVYGGWGRFTSRFLDQLPAAARSAVRAGIAAALGQGQPVAQVRPIAGFGANLHPLLTDLEISDDPSRTDCLGLGQLDVVQADGQVRLRRRADGRLLDVLYLGSLVPLLLPQRLRPLVNDLGSGLVDLSAVRTATHLDSPLGAVRAWGRLTTGRAVLARRRWDLDADQLAAWVRELGDPNIPNELSVARLRVALDWPSGVFVGGGASGPGSGLPGTAAFTERMGGDRSQFVDLLDPLHLAHLPRLLARFPHGVRVEEALPAPTPGAPAREAVVETYRKAVQPCTPS